MPESDSDHRDARHRRVEERGSGSFRRRDDDEYDSRRDSEPQRDRGHDREKEYGETFTDKQSRRRSRSPKDNDRGEHRHRRRRSCEDNEHGALRDREHRDGRHRRDRSQETRGHRSSRSHRERPKSTSRSPTRRRRHHHRKSRSPSPKTRRSNAPLPSQEDAFTGTTGAPNAAEKQKPNFNPSGKLAAETNTVAGTGIVLKYNEPPESRKPPVSQAWRLYEFKGKETLATLELGAQSCWLFGRERVVVDFPIEHPSCSKQHAVLQFRFVEKKNEFGDRIGGVKPYVIDLESANGTKVNGERIPERRYVEVMSGDVIAFGDSSREYVLMLPPKD